jgi:hypothetical protein
VLARVVHCPFYPHAVQDMSLCSIFPDALAKRLPKYLAILAQLKRWSECRVVERGSASPIPVGIGICTVDVLCQGPGL